MVTGGDETGIKGAKNNLWALVVVVVLLLTAKSHTNRSHVSNIFPCIVI